MEDSGESSNVRWKGKFAKKKNIAKLNAQRLTGLNNRGRKVMEVAESKQENIQREDQRPWKKRKLDDKNIETKFDKGCDEDSEDSFSDTSSITDNGEKLVEDDSELDSFGETFAIVGNRFVDLQLLAQNLTCTACKGQLCLKNIERELVKGLGSYIFVRCAHCLFVKKIPLTKCVQETEDRRTTRFEINLKAVFGCIHSGWGSLQLNKFLACIGVPTMPSNTFKFYERKVGPAIEKVAKESCDKAAKIERGLTIKNQQDIEKAVPLEYRENFIVPNGPMNPDAGVSEASLPEEVPQIPSSASNGFPELDEEESSAAPSLLSITPDTNEDESNLIENSAIDSEVPKQPKKPSSRWKSVTVAEFKAVSTFVVRVMLGFDTAWSKRGNGRDYDSLNGYAALSGTQSGLIVDFATENRVCRKCNDGHPKSDHDCRQHFSGSAKAIEAALAVKLATQSNILENNHLEIGIFVGDEDSSAISHIRTNCTHPVVKLCDRNHLTKGIKGLLYNIPKEKDPDRELNKNSIDYLERCFKYAMAQHPGDEAGLAVAVKNIPLHAFNIHDNCDDWCGYKDDVDYTHKTIGGGLENATLLTALTTVFNELADSSGKYAHAASSQTNESLNAAISRKAPKAICYSTSESMDYRVAAAVADKNEGEVYIIQVYRLLNLTVDGNLENYVKQREFVTTRKAEKAYTLEAKRQRIERKKKRLALRHRTENSEGVMYRSGMGLTDTPAINEPLHKNNNDDADIEDDTRVDMGNENWEVVFFDLETSGFSGNCEILQIAAGTGSMSFNKYVRPSKPIDPKATEVHGLTNIWGDLYLHGNRVQCFPLTTVLKDFVTYLRNFEKSVLLVAHNLVFDGPRLLRAIEKCSLIDDFQSSVKSLACSLQTYKQKHKLKKFKNGELTLSVLALPWIRVNNNNAHDASYDVYMLRHFAYNALTTEELIAQATSCTDSIKKYKDMKQVKDVTKMLSSLSHIIPAALRDKMAKAGIGVSELLAAFHRDRDSGVATLINNKIQYNPRKVSLQEIYVNITNYLKTLPSSED